MIYIILFLFGLIIGSFLNVCIYRIPRDESIAFPPSKCPNCQTPIKFYDNIPVISYIILGGKCRKCREKISIIYPVIELITAILILLVFIKWGFTFQSIISFFLTISLIVIFFIDLEHKIIPVNPLLILVPITLLLLDTMLFSKTGIKVFLLDYILGGVIGFLLIFLIRIISKPIFKREAMGMGDAYLFLYLGLFLGWRSLLYILFISSIIGALISIILLVITKSKEREIPFGPFISIASLIYLFFEKYILINLNIYQVFNDLIFIIKHSI